MNEDNNRRNILFFDNKSNRPSDQYKRPASSLSPSSSLMAARSVLFPPGFVPPHPSSGSDARTSHASGQFHSLPSSASGVPVSHAVLFGHLPSTATSGVPYLYPRDGHFQVDRDVFHVDRFGRHEMPDNMIHHHSSPGSSSSQVTPRRRPSLLPPTPAAPDFAYPSLVQTHFSGSIDNERFMDPSLYPSFSAYERNKSIAAAQQQAVAAAQAAHSRAASISSSMSAHSSAQSAHHHHPSLIHSHRQLIPVSRSHMNSPYDHLTEESAPKRPRLFPDSKSLQPLHIHTGDMIDMGKKPVYTPQVEAISPTLPDQDSRQELSPFKATRDELYQNINRIEREISEAETQIAKLKRKQHELEASSKSTGDGIQTLEPTTESKQQSIAQLVYSDNRKKAHSAHSLLHKLNHIPVLGHEGVFGSCLPLYNQPSDTQVYHQNREKFKEFKPKLMARLRKQKEDERKREQFLTQTYDRLSNEWKSKLETREVSASKKSKEAKLREFFEKQFPELRKQREDKERLSRAGQRIRSDADIEDIMEGLQEQEAEDKKMRSYAVIPPILQDKRFRKPIFINKNNLIEDPMTEYKDRQHINVWIESEKEIFREKFLLHPKNFGLIASYLEKKSVADCVQYYYLSKKSENYKQLLRKHVKKRTRALVKQQQQAAQAAAAAAAAQKQSALNRLQQQQQNQQNNNPTPSNSNEENTASSATEVSIDKKQNKTDDSSSDATSKSKADDVIRSNEKENEPLETNNNVKSSSSSTQVNSSSAPSTCTVCRKKLEGSQSRSKSITKSNCHLFGIPASSLPVNARACLDCRFKFIRKQCPIMSCKTPDRSVKRLKSLPQTWFDLSPEVRKSYSEQLNLPIDVKKGCTRCVLRISRKIGVFSNDRLPAPHEVWPEEEINLLKKILKEHGKNWTLVAESFRNRRSLKECKKFYYRYKYKIDAESKSPGDPDTDSDEYWNDMSDDSEETSSADEGNGRSTSDTASAPSPPPSTAASTDDMIRSTMNVGTTTGLSGDLTSGKLTDLRSLSASQASLKSDNDSSATMSADEGHGDAEAAHRPVSPVMRSTLPLDVRSLNRPQDSLFPSSSSQSFSRPPEGLIAQRQQRVPSFLINPNAPSTTNSRNHLNMSSSTGIPSTANSKPEEPTCVRDLIYQAIEMSLQSPLKGSPSPVSSNKGNMIPHSSSHPSGSFLGIVSPQVALHPFPPDSKHLSPNLVAQDRHPSARFTPPSTSSSRPEGLMMSYHVAQQQRPASIISVTDSEGTLDLSKKSSSFREPQRSQTPQRKEGRPVTPNRGLYSYPPAMPPPAHSNTDQMDVSRRDPYYVPTGGDGRGLKPAHSSVSLSDHRSIPRPPPVVPRTPVVSNRPQGPPPPLINSNAQKTGRPASPSRQHFQGSKDPRSMVGSITQGTPVVTLVPSGIPLHNPYAGHPRPPSFDALLRPHTMSKESGSITLGTPVHHGQDPNKRKSESDRKIITGPGGIVFEHPAQLEQFYRRRSPNPSPGHSSSPLSRPPSGVVTHPGDPFMQYLSKLDKDRGHPSMMSQSPHAPPPLHPTKDQLLTDFNTSRQMMARRGSSGDTVKDVHSRDTRGRESPHVIPVSSHQPRFQAMYTPLSVPGLHPGHSGPVYTPSMGDRSVYPSMSVPSSNSSPAANQIRQNVIQGWTGKPPPGTSVIQTAKSTPSPRPSDASSGHHLQRNEAPSPHSLQGRKVMGPSHFNPSPSPSLDVNLQTLVNAAVAQQNIPVPSDHKQHMMMTHDRRMIPNPYVKNELDSRSQRHDKERDDRRVSSGRPELYPDLDKNRTRHLTPDEQRQRAIEVERLQAAQRLHPGLPVMSAEAAHAYNQHRMREEQLVREQMARDQQHLLQLHDAGHLGGPRREMTRGSPPDDGRYRPLPMTLSRQQKQELDNEASRIFSQSFAKDPPPHSSPSVPGQRFTTGNLIDAIITHQINQTSSDTKNDREKDHDREQRGSRSSHSSSSSSHVRISPEGHASDHHPSAERINEDILQANQRLIRERNAPRPASETQSFTLGDTISSIISRSFGEKPPSGVPVSSSASRPPSSQPQDSRAFSSGFYSRSQERETRSPVRHPLEGIAAAAASSSSSSRDPTPPTSRPSSTGGTKDMSSSWKLRRALQQEREGDPLPSQARIESRGSREGPTLEPISPPSSSEQNEDKRSPSVPSSERRSVIDESSDRPASRHSSSRQSLEDRTPPALEILEDASEGRPPSNSHASSTSTPDSSEQKSSKDVK